MDLFRVFTFGTGGNKLYKCVTELDRLTKPMEVSIITSKFYVIMVHIPLIFLLINVSCIHGSTLYVIAIRTNIIYAQVYHFPILYNLRS